MKRIVRRSIVWLLLFCLCAAALSGTVFAADHELNKDNDWNIDGQLIMPGDTITTVVYKDVSKNDSRLDIWFYSASMSMKESFCIDATHLKEGHSLESLLDFAPAATREADLAVLAEDDVPELPQMGSIPAVWTTSYTNTSDFPIVIQSFTSSETTEHYSALMVMEGIRLYVYSTEIIRPQFVAYEPYYSLIYSEEDMTAEEIAQAPDRYVLSNEKQTLTLPVLQRPGKVFCGYNGLPGEGVFSEDGLTITYTYDWEWLKTAANNDRFYIGDRNVSPVFADAYTVSFDAQGGEMETEHLIIREEEAKDFRLYDYLPAREGYNFVGWSWTDDRSINSSELFGSDYELQNYDRDVCFYAVWLTDGELAAWGANNAVQTLAHLGGYGFDQYDADGDYAITAYDAALFLQYAVGLTERLPRYE